MLAKSFGDFGEKVDFDIIINWLVCQLVSLLSLSIHCTVYGSLFYF